MCFLKDAKEMSKYNLSITGGSGKNLCFVTGTVSAQNKGLQKGQDGARPKGSSQQISAHVSTVWGPAWCGAAFPMNND